MIYGSHVVLFSGDADADRAFLAAMLGFEHVDAGGGTVGLYRPRHRAIVEPA